MISAGSQMKSSLRWLGSPRGRQALTTELARRRLVEFTTYTAPWYRPAQVHRFLAAQLEAVERGDLRRLMVFMPPRTGKTEMLVRWLAWCLGRHPDWPMLYTSYAADLAWEDVYKRQVLGKLQWFYAATPDIGLTKGGIDWRTNYHEEMLDCLAPAARHFRSHPRCV